METENEYAKDPRFCVNLEITKGWATSIELVTEGGILPPQIIEIDYDKLPIRCRVCSSWKHKASECKEMQKRPGKGREIPGQNRHIHPQEKGKNIVLDQDGFQQVQHRRNIRRNIFEGNRDRGQYQHWRDNFVSHPHTFGVAAPAATHNNFKKGGSNGHNMNAERRGPAGSGTVEGSADQEAPLRAVPKESDPAGTIALGPTETVGRGDCDNSGTNTEKEHPGTGSEEENQVYKTAGAKAPKGSHALENHSGNGGASDGVLRKRQATPNGQ